jgi:diguanylate cyclase (GGDEF)-like protein
MTRLRSRVPGSVLGRARLITASVACVSLCGQATQVGSIAHGDAWYAMSYLAMAALVAIVVTTYRKGRTLWFDPVAVPVLVVMVGSGLVDSINTTGPCIAVMISQSLYGSSRSWLIRSVGAVAALPISVALSPFALSRPVEWYSPTVLAIMPQLVLIAIVLRAMCTAMIRQEQASVRATVLAETGHQLLAVKDVPQARAIGAQATARLAATSPGTAMAVLVGRDDRAVVVADAGFDNPVTGTELPGFRFDQLGVVDVGTAPELDVLRMSAPHVRHWRTAALEANGIELLIVAGGRRMVASDLFAAFESLSNQVALAEAGCLLNAELNQQANHDHLTTLPTRALFFQRLSQAVEQPQGTVALLNIDLDDFKRVNDTYGHGAGDELLVEVAARLQAAGGPGALPARFGGDEFGVLLTQLDDAAEATDIAERICRLIVQPVKLSAATVSVGASVGVALAEPGLTASELLRCADIAMYSAKAHGKNRVQQFSSAQHGSIARNRTLDEHFGEAIRRGELVLRYQPLIDLRTGACSGVEAVVRWEHPVLGTIEPGDVLTVAERVGEARNLGVYVLDQACRQMAKWAATPEGSGMSVSVNVHGREFTRPEFAATVAEILRATGLAPERLVLEVAELEFLDHHVAGAQLRAVAAEGVRIALDDFGNGYGSLASLWSLPIHQIKVDVRCLGAEDNFASLRLIASVGELLGAETVAQGLTRAQDEIGVREAGIARGQGELLGGALPADEVLRWTASCARTALPTG